MATCTWPAQLCAAMYEHHPCIPRCSKMAMCRMQQDCVTRTQSARAPCHKVREAGLLRDSSGRGKLSTVTPQLGPAGLRGEFSCMHMVCTLCHDHAWQRCMRADSAALPGSHELLCRAVWCNGEHQFMQTSTQSMQICRLHHKMHHKMCMDV